MPYPDLTEALQARILADLKAEKVGPAPPNRLDPGESHRVGALEAHIATLEEAMAKAETLGEQRRQEAETAFKRVEVLEAQIATLEEAVGKAEALGEQRRQEVATEVQRTEALEAQIVTLEEAVAKAETLGEQRRQQAETVVKRADDLVAELVEITSELIEMSKRMAEQTTATDKLRAEFDEYRSRSRG